MCVSKSARVCQGVLHTPVTSIAPVQKLIRGQGDSDGGCAVNIKPRGDRCIRNRKRTHVLNTHTICGTGPYMEMYLCSIGSIIKIQL